MMAGGKDAGEMVSERSSHDEWSKLAQSLILRRKRAGRGRDVALIGSPIYIYRPPPFPALKSFVAGFVKCRLAVTIHQSPCSSHFRCIGLWILDLGWMNKEG